MIIGKQSYDMAKNQMIQLTDGTLGENILLDFDPHVYPIGTQFKIGEVILQVTEDCSMCKHLAIFDPKLPKLIRHARGKYCKIIHGGDIMSGQTATLRKKI